MSNEYSPLENDEAQEDQSELTADDLAILRAFDAREEWAVPQDNAVQAAPSSPQSESREQADAREEFSDEDMLLLFAAEADEDIDAMSQVVQQYERDQRWERAHLTALQRSAHKLRGTAASINCHAMSALAHDAEIITDSISRGSLAPEQCAQALVQAIQALQQTLSSVLGTGQESSEPLQAFEAFCAANGIQLQPSSPTATGDTGAFEQLYQHPEEERIPVHLITRPLDENTPPETPAITQFTRVDAQRIQHLMSHSEQLVELRIPLENAQTRFEVAMVELQEAQARLQQLEPLLLSFPAASRLRDAPLYADHTPSSLVARILTEAAQKDSYLPRMSRARPRLVGEAAPSWDALEMERFSEREILLHSLNEAIADVSIATIQLRGAFSQLRLAVQKFLEQAAVMRNDAQLLRSAPVNALVPRLQRALQMSALAQERQVEFEVTGDTLEIDQDILELLATVLLQLLRTCISDTFAIQGELPPRIWLHAEGLGNDLAIELGFSTTVRGGALDAVSESVRRLKGTISLQLNRAGGVSFHLRLPRSQGTVHCLVVRAAEQQLLVPFSQIERIAEGPRESFDLLYSLDDLLGFPTASDREPRVQPILVLLQAASRKRIGVAVDDIDYEAEFIVKPLPAYLQRPGITGNAVDGEGRVLLMLDMPEVIRHAIALHKDDTGPEGRNEGLRALRQPKILIADDSAYLRQSLAQTMQRANANYSITEARDGLEALMLLVDDPPDVFFLDMEMPQLNGYDLLDIMRLYPELAHVKVAVLTSRSSEKHRQRAMELGASVYLTKPCSQERLIETVRSLLA